MELTEEYGAMLLYRTVLGSAAAGRSCARARA